MRHYGSGFSIAMQSRIPGQAESLTVRLAPNTDLVVGLQDHWQQQFVVNEKE